MTPSRWSRNVHHHKFNISRLFVEELLGLVDLGGQVWTAAAIGMVEQHELTVLLANVVLVQFPLTMGKYRISISLVALRGSNLDDIREFENERGFTTGHARFKSAIKLLTTIAIAQSKVQPTP